MAKKKATASKTIRVKTPKVTVTKIEKKRKKSRRSGAKPPGKGVSSTSRRDVAYDDLPFAQQQAIRKAKTLQTVTTTNQKAKVVRRAYKKTAKKAAVKKSS
jgi:hypothetical protein